MPVALRCVNSAVEFAERDTRNSETRTRSFARENPPCTVDFASSATPTVARNCTERDDEYVPPRVLVFVRHAFNANSSMRKRSDLRGVRWRCVCSRYSEICTCEVYRLVRHIVLSRFSLPPQRQRRNRRKEAESEVRSVIIVISSTMSFPTSSAPIYYKRAFELINGYYDHYGIRLSVAEAHRRC